MITAERLRSKNLSSLHVKINVRLRPFAIAKITTAEDLVPILVSTGLQLKKTVTVDNCVIVVAMLSLKTIEEAKSFPFTSSGL